MYVCICMYVFLQYITWGALCSRVKTVFFCVNESYHFFIIMQNGEVLCSRIRHICGVNKVFAYHRFFVGIIF